MNSVAINTDVKLSLQENTESFGGGVAGSRDRSSFNLVRNHHRGHTSLHTNGQLGSSFTTSQPAFIANCSCLIYPLVLRRDFHSRLPSVLGSYNLCVHSSAPPPHQYSLSCRFGSCDLSVGAGLSTICWSLHCTGFWFSAIASLHCIETSLMRIGTYTYLCV